MAKSSSTPMSRPAASRIASAQSRTHGGQIPAGSFASRADATAQRNAGKASAPQGKKN